MAIYICDECGKTLDGDYHPCVEVEGLDFCCEECATELEEEADLEKEFKSMKAEYERETISGLQRQIKGGWKGN